MERGHDLPGRAPPIQPRPTRKRLEILACTSGSGPGWTSSCCAWRASSGRCTTRWPTCRAAWPRGRARHAPDFAGMRYGPPKADDGSDACYVKDVAGHPHGAPAPQLAAPHLQHGQRPSRRATRIWSRRSARSCPSSRPSCPPGGDAENRYMDLSRTTAEIGYKPRIGVERGLAEYVELAQDPR